MVDKTEDEGLIEEIRARNEERRKEPLPVLSPYYTKKQWERIVGYGVLPEDKKIGSNNDDE